MHGLGENKGRLRTQETGESKVKFLARYPAGRLRAQETGENTKRPARTEIGRPAVKFLARYPKGRLRILLTMQWCGDLRSNPLARSENGESNKT